MLFRIAVLGLVSISIGSSKENAEVSARIKAYKQAKSFSKPSFLRQKDSHNIQGCPAAEPCNGDSFSENLVSEETTTKSTPKQAGNSITANNTMLVFVSFSMPEASLKQLAEESKKIPITFIMRGLVNNSFIETSQRLNKLNLVVDINPELFDHYHIDCVPVFISLSRNQEVGRIIGNVSLRYAWEKLNNTQNKQRDFPWSA